MASLIKALGNQSEAVYEAAVEALARIGAVAVDSLIEVLDAKHPIREQFVMRAIWTGDKKLDVRRGIARALVMIGDKRAVKPLIGVLSDDDWDVVSRYAAKALDKLGWDDVALEVKMGKI